MIRIGLTGGIASGKSTAAEYLRKLGATVIDADEISRALTAKGGTALPLLREKFGDDVFDGDELDRRKMSQIIFACEKKRETLNEIIHPLVYQEIERRVSAAQTAGEKAAILDIPLLFETGYQKHCDVIWLICLGKNAQIQRFMARNGVSLDDARARVSAQMPLSQKLEMLGENDRRIDNDADISHIYHQVKKLWNEILTDTKGA